MTYLLLPPAEFNTFAAALQARFIADVQKLFSRSPDSMRMSKLHDPQFWQQKFAELWAHLTPALLAEFLLTFQMILPSGHDFDIENWEKTFASNWDQLPAPEQTRMLNAFLELVNIGRMRNEAASMIKTHFH